jgi:hypothetical protein
MLTAPEGKSGLRECRGVDRRRADRDGDDAARRPLLAQVSQRAETASGTAIDSAPIFPRETWRWNFTPA